MPLAPRPVLYPSVLLLVIACSGDDQGEETTLSGSAGTTAASAGSTAGSTATATATLGDESTTGPSSPTGTSSSSASEGTSTSTTTATTDGTTTTTSSSTTASTTTGEPADGRAFLHADVWSVWWNDRTRCGAERTFLEICQRRGDECSIYQQALAACDPNVQIYGQVGPEKQGEALCQRSKLPAIGGCDASKYDYDALRFYWYGAEWQGNWPVATLKVFPQGADWKGGGELIALSNVPGAAQAAMSGIDNHGLDYGCAMLGVTSGDDKYLHPFGGFAWVEVPTNTPVTIAALAASNFADNPFAGCSRGMKTQDPWITDAPGAVLGCVYVLEDMVFAPDTHYAWRYGQIVALDGDGPPAELIAGFALPEVGVDVTTRAACAL